MVKNVLMPVLLIFLSVFCFACGEKVIVCPDIPDAENSVFADDGTLFITGGHNIYRILQNENGQYEKEKLYDGEAGFAGMAIHDNHLYAAYSKNSLDINFFEIITQSIAGGVKFCDIIETLKNSVMDKKLLVADLNTDEISFTEVCTLDEMLIPNGIAIDSRGRLYIADETMVPGGKILRVTLNNGIAEKEVWMDQTNGAISPNGIVIKNDILYFTDLDLSKPISAGSLVKKVDINRFDSNQSGALTVLYKRPGGLMAPFSLFDDLTTATIQGKTGVIVTDYNLGSLLFIEDKITSGKLYYETEKGMFASPSSVIRGQGPDFSENQLLVTEKGLLMVDPYSDYGNKLVSINIE